MLERNQGFRAYFSSSFIFKHSSDVNKHNPLIWRRNPAPQYQAFSWALTKRAGLPQSGEGLRTPQTFDHPFAPSSSFSVRKLKRRKEKKYLKFSHKSVYASLKTDLCSVTFRTLNVNSSSQDYCWTSFFWKKKRTL